MTDDIQEKHLQVDQILKYLHFLLSDGPDNLHLYKQKVYQMQKIINKIIDEYIINS